MGRVNHNHTTASIGLACGNFSSLLIDVGDPSPVWTVSSLGKWAQAAFRTAAEKPGEASSFLCGSLLPAPVLNSCFGSPQ